MAYTIAVAGKGGTGKTTLAALIIGHLLKSDQKPILAVDADPNSNLNEVLGITFDQTVVSTVDEIMDKKEDLSPGITKERLLDYQLQDALVESKGFDLLVMGRTEGPGCYCHANNLLRGFMEKLKGNYRDVVMDNEAGMEHLSRRTTRDVDTLLVTANPTPVALRSAKRIQKTAGNLKLKIKKIYLVLNETGGDSRGEEKMEDVGLPLLGRIPYDEEIMERSIKAKSLLDLPESSVALQGVKEIMKKLEIL
ncbi:MAG: AAA family ATPase [Candidatus Omnitrophica bacterium]|nr:AAA family ATPase [Candidatus Omnitrophota bacterium]